jgi:hypothetical protein
MEIDVMLCDYAQVADNKLFISGANINRMSLPPDRTAPYVVNFSAAGLVRVPWTATNEEHTLGFILETEDGRPPELPEGAGAAQGVGGEMRFTVGRPPQLSIGEEQMVPFGFNFQGLPLMRLGRYALSFSLDGMDVRRLPFTVALLSS